MGDRNVLYLDGGCDYTTVFFVKIHTTVYRKNVYICRTESLCCTAETGTAL